MEKRNVTISLDEETARWARVEAARKDMSVSRFIGDMLAERSSADRKYDEAMQSYLTARPRKLRRAGGYPAREELHDRAGLR